MTIRARWIVPSRGRPTRLRAMLAAGLRLDQTADFAVCLDRDDPSAPGYAALRPALDGQWPGRITWLAGPRDTMPGWTNQVAAAPGSDGWAVLGSIGDDHLPLTPGWSATLAGTAAAAGLAYPDDLHRGPELPTVIAIARPVTAALGWMCLPGLAHYYADDVWRDLGAVYVPAVQVEHKHPVFGSAPLDATYADAAPWFDADRAVYETWRDAPGPDGMAACQATVKAAAASSMALSS